MVDELARDLGARRSTGEPDRHAVCDERCRSLRDLPLLVVMARALVAERELVEHAHRHGAAVRACEQALFLEELEVATDRRRRDIEPCREIGDLHAAVRREVREDRRESFGLMHVADDTPRLRVRARSGLTPNIIEQ